MNPFAAALGIANAVLYEGYILFPYTASARKNKMRWQFGVLVPQEYARNGTGEPSQAQTEILLDSNGDAKVEVSVRFLQVEMRGVEAARRGEYEPVELLTVGEKQYFTFDEGIEREIRLRLNAAAEAASAAPIAFSADERVEPLRNGRDELVGRIVRRRWPLHGAVTVECEPVPCHPQERANGASRRTKVRVRIENHSAAIPGERSAALRTAFLSTHTLLRVEGGRFLSVLDPPAEARRETESLVNRHTWPVLVTDPMADTQRSPLALSSPIVLYDFPQVASQSEDDTFDATEIDELMMLSVLSLSDGERAEARATDPRARKIVERAERFGSHELQRLHGITQRDPFQQLDVPSFDCVFIDGVKVAKGSNVRLHPKRRADVWDKFLENKLATVRAVHQDVENQMYVAVTVDDDPASELHDWYGRSLFFYPDEVEPVTSAREVFS